MADMKDMLTETAFTLPGTKTKVPRWAVLLAAGGLIIILLFVKKAGSEATATEEATAEEEEEEGVGAGDWLDDLITQIEQPQGIVESPSQAGSVPYYEYAVTPTVAENAALGAPPPGSLRAMMIEQSALSGWTPESPQPEHSGMTTGPLRGIQALGEVRQYQEKMAKPSVQEIMNVSAPKKVLKGTAGKSTSKVGYTGAPTVKSTAKPSIQQIMNVSGK